MGTINLPSHQKAIFVNLVPNPRAAFTAGRRFEGMWSSEWDWAWIKAQIDAALSLGANGIRALGPHWGIGRGRVDQAQFTGRVVQTASYCEDRGAYFYLCGDSIRSGSTEDEGNVTAATQGARYASYLRELQGLGNSIGFDICNEADGVASGGYFSTGYMGDVIAAIKDRGITIPLTYSTHEVLSPTSGATWINAKGALFDYLDFHIYNFTATGTYLDYFIQNFPTKDLLIGETGKNTTTLSATGGGDANTQVADLSVIYRLGLSGHPRVRGVCHWAAADLENASTFAGAGLASVDAGQWGLFDTNTTPGVFTARPHLTAMMRRFTRGTVGRCNGV